MSEKKNRVTIADVAEYAQVSTMTVSRVVNNRGQVSDAMMAHVHDAMQALGYKPNRIARSLVSNQTFRIGVIVPNISSLFFSTILESAERTFWDNDYHMMLCSTNQSNRREQDILDLFEQDRVDGVLILGSHLSRDDFNTVLKNQRAAIVLNGDVDPEIAGQILFDETVAYTKAVEYLHSLGRKKLAYIGEPERTHPMRERRRAFQQVIEELADDCVEGWLINPRPDMVAALHQHFYDFPHTDGILCFNDEMAIHVMRILADLGKHIPDDVAIIGYDNVSLANRVTPRLTTLSLQLTTSELGELAANMLLARIEGQGKNEPCILTHELVIRDSTP